MQLTDGITTAVLPDDLEWTDEFSFTSITQDINRTIGGSLIISEGVLVKGKPITLVGGVNVWVKRSLVKQLYSMINLAGKTYVLTLPDLSTVNVIFDQDEPMVAEPVFRQTIQTDDNEYTLKLKFIEVL